MNNLQKIKKFNKIAEDIKSIKIQGARNIAKSALYAYKLIKTPEAKKKLINLRPTEPMLVNVLNRLDDKKQTYKKILKHFDEAQGKINKYVFSLVEDKQLIFTHCHSTNVINALAYAKKHGKNFQVINTETRPLFQGRKTARELRKNKIKVTMVIDSAAMIAITRGKGNLQVDKVFFGADAILNKGVVNKIGSGMFAQIAKDNNVPVYIIADSWKYSPENVKIEERDFNEVWNTIPKKIKVLNPAFEFIPKRNIKAIVSEYGILSYNKFLKKVK